MNKNAIILLVSVAASIPLFGSEPFPLSKRSPEAEMEKKVFLSKVETLEFVWLPEVDIWAGKYEITLGQLTLIFDKAARNPDRYAARYVEDHDAVMNSPAVMIGWHEASQACKTLNRKYGEFLPDGYVYRLPTEKEWEYMASRGDSRKFPWGDAWPPEVMADGVLPNFQGIEVVSIMNRKPSSIRGIPGYRDGWPSVAPVRFSGANELGIYGLAGNVEEWCDGWYDESRKLRLLKGGSAGSLLPSQCKIQARNTVYGQSPLRSFFLWGAVRNQGHIFSGFRVVIGKPDDG